MYKKIATAHQELVDLLCNSPKLLGSFDYIDVAIPSSWQNNGITSNAATRGSINAISDVDNSLQDMNPSSLSVRD
jgi:hypothetical protein